MVCVSSCPSTDDYTKFICYDDYQSASDSSTVVAWSNVANYFCMFQAKTYTG